MLIRYAYGEDGQIFYELNSNIIPRVGETIIFDAIDYDNCVKKFKFVGGKKVEIDEYIIDDFEDEMFTVTDVCYCISAEEIEVDVTVMGYDYGSDHTEYLENLAKDVNVPNDYNS